MSPCGASFTLQNTSWNLRGQLTNSTVPLELFEPAKYAVTCDENLAGKPHCQQDYVDLYPEVFQPSPNTLEYHRFYYQMQQNVNDQIQRVLDALNAHPDMAENTIVIFTSDHGDCLAPMAACTRSGIKRTRKTTHVPFIVHNPTLFAGRQTLDEMTSHADLLPTMLGLAGLDPSRLRHKLAKTPHRGTSPGRPGPFRRHPRRDQSQRGHGAGVLHDRGRGQPRVQPDVSGWALSTGR